MKQKVTIVRLIIYLLLSVGLLYAISWIVLFALSIVPVSESLQQYKTWAVLTLLLVTLGTALFGLLAVLINRINPFEDKGRLYLTPFFLIVVIFFGYKICYFFFNSWVVQSERSPIIFVCITVGFIFTAIKTFKMLSHNRYDI